MSHYRTGFTLIEVLVTVTIMIILVGVVTRVAINASVTGRDADRQADLRALQAAVEAYRRDHGRYPPGCNAAGTWSGEAGTEWACPASHNNQYITGLVPGYINRLPNDPNLSGCIDTTAPRQCGYAYMTNTEGSVYKIIAMNTVEGPNVTPDHPLASCDITAASANDIRRSLGGDGWCGARFDGSTIQQTESLSAPAPDNWFHCNITSDRFRNSFAVWGGFAEPIIPACDSAGRCIIPPPSPDIDLLDSFADPTYSSAVKNSLPPRVVANTTNIICR
jgi:prepilin-type N-terminal cleavage/methylation domain-containing protein